MAGGTGGFNYACPYCRGPLFIGPDLSGQTVSCPHCRGHLQLPHFAPPAVEFALVSSSSSKVPIRRKSSSTTIVVALSVLCLGMAAGLVFSFAMPERERQKTPRAEPQLAPIAQDSPTLVDQARRGQDVEPTEVEDPKPKAKIASGPPRSLEALHQLDDGPPDFTHKEWVEIKRELYGRGMLGYEVKDGIYKYRNDPRNHLGSIRATRDFRGNY